MTMAENQINNTIFEATFLIAEDRIGFGPEILFLKRNGDFGTSPVVGDKYFNLFATGETATQTIETSKIIATATSIHIDPFNPGSEKFGSDLQFWTHPDSLLLPTAQRMNIDKNGTVTINTPENNTNGLTVHDIIVSTSRGLVSQDNLGTSQQAYLYFQKSRLGGIINSSDYIGELNYQAHDGTSFITTSIIRARSSGTIGTNRIASDLEFWTRPDAVAASRQRLVILSTGEVVINAPDSGTGLTVGGLGAGVVLSSSGDALSSSAGTIGQLLTSNGAGVAPSFQAATLFVPPIILTNASETLTVNSVEYMNRATLITAALPASSAVGDTIEIVGMGAGGWKISQAANQIIHFLGASTTLGATGFLSSTTQYDCMKIKCLVANLEWVVVAPNGNITIN